MAHRRGVVSPRHWRVRSNLAVVLVVPALAFLVLAGLNVTTSVRSAHQYGRGATSAEFGRQVTSLVHELQAERDLSAGYLSEGRQEPSGKLKNAAFYLREQVTNVDPAVARFRTARPAEKAVGSQAQANIDLAATSLDDLDTLRTAVTSRKLTEAAARGRYTRMISALLDVDLQIGQRSDSRDFGQSVTALNDLSRAKEAASRVRGQLYSVGFLNSFQVDQFQQLSAALAEQQATLERFRTDATDQQRRVYDEQVNGQAVLSVKRIEDQAINRQQAPQLNIDPQQWYAAASTRMELIRAFESSLLDSVISQARTQRSDARRSAIGTGVVIAAILVIALLTPLLIARSRARPLRRMPDSARDVHRGEE